MLSVIRNESTFDEIVDDNIQGMDVLVMDSSSMLVANGSRHCHHWWQQMLSLPVAAGLLAAGGGECSHRQRVSLLLGTASVFVAGGSRCSHHSQ